MCSQFEMFIPKLLTHRQRICLILFLVWMPFTVSADAYLDAIQEAADGVNLDPATETESAAGHSGSAGVAAKGMPAGMAEKDFASFLQQKYLGSFAFYKKLSSSKKDRVFKAYADQPDIDFIRDQIKRQYLDR